MADRGDTHYHVPKLNAWFLVSSLILLGTAFWMVIDDWDRSWKGYQREFREIEIERARAALSSPEALAAKAEEERLARELEETEAKLEEQKATIEEAEQRLHVLRGTQFRTTEAEKSAKQDFNWARFQAEEGHGSAEELARKEQELVAAVKAKEDADAAVAAQETIVADLYAELNTVESRMKAAGKSIDLVRKKLAKLDPADAPTKIANVIRDFPGMDFIGPNIKVNKVVLDDLTFELNFTKKPRIDMCQTCHLSIDLEGYEGELEHPYRSHPRQDLFLSAKSPHPVKEVGCTICHRGSGESLHFVRADHRPSDEAEAERWEKDYHWHKQHHWDYPMLSAGYVEASCVQCHKTSMELIAEDAPKVSRGYQLFERYGCYACHKVEWFPTKRRPGPSLKKVATKVSPEWLASWVADPRGFRPSTWMPQIFHLENFAPEETIVVSNYGTGREIKGQEWNDAMVASAAAYVLSRSESEALPPVPLEGDPLRGRELFRLSGCLACHSMAPFPGEEPESKSDLALEAHGTNEHGPNLRGIASKVSPQWLFQWIKSPTSYWPETRMPDLRLPDQDVADVVAYIFEDPEGYFHDTPEGWSTSMPPAGREVLMEAARWYYGNLTRADIEAAFAGKWADDEALLIAVGEKVVTGQGCQSCHEIAGWENAMPIGTELTDWGSKTVDKLDAGLLPYILADERGWDHHQTKQYKSYREPWLEQKLHAPRSYDRLKLKNPTEKLKMPWFDFEQDEVEAIATFVVGLVKDEVQRARMVPDEGQRAMDTGLRVIRQKNCAACHLIEPGAITYNDEDGVRRTVAGQVFPISDEEFIAPRLGESFHPFLKEYEEYTEEDLEEVIVELLRAEPGVGAVGDTVVIEGAENVDAIETTPAWGGDFVPLVVDYYRNVWGTDESGADVSKTGDPDGEGRVQDVDGEWRDYTGEEYVKIRWTYAPPLLVDEGYKVQRDWFYQFLQEPYPLRRQMRVKMPTFSWGEGEAGAVADYFAQTAQKTWPERYARRLLVQEDQTPETLAQAMAAAGTPASADDIQGIVEGYAPSIEASMPKLEQFVGSDGIEFTIPPPVNPDYEPLPARAPAVLEAKLAAHPDFFERIGRLTGDPQAGPNCFQCHWLEGNAPVAEGPIAWAPDLQYVRERLRPDWVREWLTNPASIYPGTAMPANFVGTQYQEVWPYPPEQQIEDVLTWLFNLDRDPTR